MDELQDQLIKELGVLILLLEKHEVSSWASTFKSIQNSVNIGNKKSLDFLTSMHAGMGSFNDLIICQINGHKIEKKEESEANNELVRLGKLIANIAQKIKRKLNQS